MRRIATVVLMSMVLSACSPLVDNVQQAAQAKLGQLLADQFGKRLQTGIDTAIGRLAMKGGYLDDPLVRILLPPPLGMAIGVARELQKNPQAALLETLLNQAAEHAVPVAGPILKDIVAGMDTASLESLLDSGETAAADSLKEKGGTIVRKALLPVITETLHANGAVELYGRLAKAKEEADRLAASAQDLGRQSADVQALAEEQLGAYVTDRAVSGLFVKVAEEERTIRADLGGAF